MTPTMKNQLRRACGGVLVAVNLFLLAACGGGSGGGTTPNPAPNTGGNNGGGTFVYSGPSPQNADVQRFQAAFYNNLVNDNRCGTCHTRGGAGTTAFVDRSDVNFAYGAALTLVNLQNPAASAIVQKVYNGHNCWEASTAACRVQMISFIEAWANAGAGASTSVRLTSPVDRDPNGPDTNGDGVGDGFRSFPASAGAAGFVPGATPPALYGLLRTYCSACHSGSAATPQQPYFASSDPLVAYEAVKSKIDLNDPALTNPALKSKSRLVVRLRDEFHNCWSGSCANDAAAMQAAIRDLAVNQSPVTLLDPIQYRSKAQILNDGIVGSSGGRFELYQIALWRFLEGEGGVASDTSGVAPAISLTLNGLEGEGGDYKWVGGGGIQFTSGVARGTAAASRKLYDLIAPAGEYSVEAWVLPANVTDEDRAIFGYSDGSSNRNLLLGQTMYNYDYYNRSSMTNNRGEPRLSTDPDRELLQAALQHVVVTYDPVSGRRIYVNGQYTGDTQPADRGTLANDWSPDYVVLLGDNLARNAAWKGAVRMAAVHKRALSATQVTQNFNVKPGEKRYVLFNVSLLPNMPASCSDSSGAEVVSYCYIYFEVSQYDNYGYLFTRPYFISLNPDADAVPYGLVIKGIRIGINGKLAPVGQAYTSVNTTIDQASYVFGAEPQSGQRLSNVGTVIPKLSGADADLFYLEFDRIGSNNDQASGATVLPFAYSLDGASEIDLGWRTFDEINASFSQLTGVRHDAVIVSAPATVRVSDVFAVVRQQLPAVEGFSGFLASHQTAVGQLAIAYCSALINDTSLRQGFFTGGSSPAFFRANWRSNLVDPLVNGFFGGGVASQPAATAVGDELMYLLTFAGDSNRKPGICSGGCDDARTLDAARIACAAALGNAATTLQ